MRINYIHPCHSRHGSLRLVRNDTIVFPSVSVGGRADDDVWVSLSPKGFVVSVPLILQSKARLRSVRLDAQVQAMTIGNTSTLRVHRNFWRLNCKEYNNYSQTILSFVRTMQHNRFPRPIPSFSMWAGLSTPLKIWEWGLEMGLHMYQSGSLTSWFSCGASGE